MLDLNIAHHFSSGVYARQMHLPAGHYAQSHKHHFDHLSILASGRVTLEVDGVAAIHEGPACLQIEADTIHTITAITDSVWFCIHATNVTEVDQIDHTLIKEA